MSLILGGIWIKALAHMTRIITSRMKVVNLLFHNLHVFVQQQSFSLNGLHEMLELSMNGNDCLIFDFLAYG
jgi:hypothetical protein